MKLNHLLPCAVLALPVPSYAAVSVYTVEADFLASTTDLGTDTFDDLRADTYPSAPQSRNAGGHSYSVDTTAPNFYVVGLSSDHWLSNDNEHEAITFTFEPGITAVGGRFFITDPLGEVMSVDTVVTINYASGSTTHTLTDAQPTGFLGFTSDEEILSLTVNTSTPGATDPDIFPTINNFTIGVADAVPEPSAVLLGGLGFLALLRRRRD